MPEAAVFGVDNQTDYMVTYIGYYDNTLYDWSLKGPNCSIEFANNFVALFAPYTSETETGVYSNMTALFCEPTYTSQLMSVTVNASTHEVHHYEAINEPTNVTALGEIFNISNFEYLIANGQPQTYKKYNWSDATILAQSFRIQDYGITWPNSPMIGFSVAVNETPVSEWSRPEALRRTFEKVQQLLFISAFSTLSTSLETPVVARPGLRQDTPGAVILVRTISIIVEAGLAVIIAFTILPLVVLSVPPRSHAL